MTKEKFLEEWRTLKAKLDRSTDISGKELMAIVAVMSVDLQDITMDAMVIALGGEEEMERQIALEIEAIQKRAKVSHW